MTFNFVVRAGWYKLPGPEFWNGAQTPNVLHIISKPTVLFCFSGPTILSEAKNSLFSFICLFVYFTSIKTILGHIPYC